MKRGTPGHIKTKRLMRYCDIDIIQACGSLELLWHTTARLTPRGEIGKYSDSEIEEEIGWKGKPGALIQGLVQAGWLDCHPVHRLIVHDWHDHADDAVKKLLKRHGWEFVSISTTTDMDMSRQSPDVSPLPKPLPLPLPLPLPKPEPLPVPSPESVVDEANRFASEDVTGHSTSTEDDPQVIIHRTVQELLPDHPRPSPSGWAEAAMAHEVGTNRLDAKEFCSQIKKTHAEHCRYWERERARDPNAFVPIFHLWIRDGYYLNRNCTKDPPKPKQAGKGARLHQELAELKSPEGRP